MRKKILTLTFTSLLAGCSSLTDTPYSRPEMPLPATWEVHHSGRRQALLQDKWWEEFGDRVLNQLIEKGLLQNADLAAAGINLKLARLQAGLANTNISPDITTGISANSAKDLSTGTPSKRSYGSSLSLAWELDFWGRLSHTRDAAAWNTTATQYDLESTRLSLIKTTAATYWSIAYLNSQLVDAKADIEATRKVEWLIARRYQAGNSGLADLSIARQNRAEVEASFEQLLQQREDERHILIMLLNEDVPSAVVARYTLSEGSVPDIPIDTPASVLAQRPDVGAAEARVRSYLANDDSVRAAMYPTFSLTGSFSTGGENSGHTFSTPVGSWGPTVTLPFLQWNTVKLNADISHAQYEASVIAFRQTFYQALAEVGETLLVRESLIKQGQALQESMLEAKKTEAISAARYRVGAENIRFLLDDQQHLRSAQSAVTSNRRDQLLVQMTLYQAIGGGDKYGVPCRNRTCN